jgi:CRISPR-associated endonuclease/helicase Cas3
LCSYHLESHPGRLLSEHLKAVSNDAVAIIHELKSFSHCLDDFRLIEAIKIIGLSHDVGKSTVFFQEYLYGKKHDPFLKSHSTSSSLYGYNAANKTINDDFLSFATLMIIQGHHGGIPSPSDAMVRIHRHKEMLIQQIHNIKYEEELNNFLIAEGFPVFSECMNMLNSKANELHRLKKAFDAGMKTMKPLSPYFIVNMLFSALIDADRTNAAGIIANQKRLDIPYESVLNYADNVEKRNAERFGNKSEIIKLRKIVQQTVLSKAATRRKILSLTAPTGSGKTLTAFLFANILRRQISKETGRRPRIIYVSPFLSIIDQNVQVIAEALGLKNDNDNTNDDHDSNAQSALMLTHHHLAVQNVYEGAENETYSNSISQLLIEGWNAEVIVTTFVQFLETLIGARASFLRKLHNIAGSIIILDEVQSIDYKHWLLIHDCLEFLANEFDTRIVLMTATQPLIFSKNEVLELFDSKQIFQERVELKVDLNGISLSEFLSWLNKLIDEYYDKNILIIMNTINSSTKVYDTLQVKIGEDEKFYLSSQVTPIERRQRIKSISSRLSNCKRTVLVSTQVVEAGVDFDFDIVVRDLSPVDSIIQAAGRCNRNGKKPKEESPIYIRAIHDENGNYFAIQIYGNVLIEKTRETLIEQKNDLKISQLADIYYQKVVEGGSRKVSTEILDAIHKMSYDVIEEFKVIENEPTVSIFVEIDKEAEDIWKEYKNAVCSSINSKKRGTEVLRKFFLANRNKFYRYIINSRPSDPKIQSIPVEDGFYHISLSALHDYYGYTGLKTVSNII